LSQQAEASKQQQDRLASAQLLVSWENELGEVKKDRDIADATIRQGSSQILQVLASIESYSSYLQGLTDPREVVEQASSIYNQDKQSLSAVTERVNMLQKRLGEEPELKRQLAQAELDIAMVEKKLRKTLLPSLPQGVDFSPELLDEASQMRDSLNESVSRIKTQIEESMTRIIELKQFLEENKDTEDQLLLAMRLAFALALIPQAKGRNPEFLFLDEPLGSSDKVRREGILALMHGELSENFKQIFLISHVGDLEVEADTIIEMDNGAVREVVTRKPSIPQSLEIPA